MYTSTHSYSEADWIATNYGWTYSLDTTSVDTAEQFSAAYRALQRAINRKSPHGSPNPLCRYLADHIQSNENTEIITWQADWQTGKQNTYTIEYTNTTKNT